MGKASLQDRFLRRLHAGQTPLTVITVNGYQLKGRVTAWDRHVLLVESGGKQNLVCKSAISTLVWSEPDSGEPKDAPSSASDGGRESTLRAALKQPHEGGIKEEIQHAWRKACGRVFLRPRRIL